MINRRNLLLSIAYLEYLKITQKKENIARALFLWPLGDNPENT
jgi:hypothetical protein